MEVIQRKSEKCALVSVICLTYNQKKYIRQALEGLLMQNTSFDYEIIVHDDASTDGTKDIVREYAVNYPDKITVLLQDENQYSQKKKIGLFVEPYVTGKYVAFCEGDDFWTGNDKLQKQVEAMEKHKECVMCVHTVQGISEDGLKELRQYPQFFMESRICRAEEVMHWMLADGQWVFQTSSYFMYSDLWREMELNGPEYVKQSHYGDLAMMRYCAAHGEFYYINEAMSCYRMGAMGSVTAKNRSIVYNVALCEKRLKAVVLFDEETNGRFHQDALVAKERYEAAWMYAKREYREILNNKRLYRHMSNMNKIHIFISAYVPAFDRIYYGLRKIVRGY